MLRRGLSIAVLAASAALAACGSSDGTREPAELATGGGEPGSSDRTEPRDEPVRDEPVRDEPVRDEPVRDEPVRDDEARDEPVRDEPVRDEEARASAPVVAGGDRLAVARVLGRPPFSYPRAVGAHVFGWGAEGAWNSLVAFGAESDAPERVTPLGTAGIPASAEYTDAVVSDCLMTVDGEDLVAIDPVAGAARWRVALPIPASVTRRQHPFVATRLARAGDVLVGFVGDPILGSWAIAFGVSFGDGRMLWQRDAPSVAMALATSGDRALALLGPGVMQAIDVRTGDVAWQVAARSPWRGWERAGATGDAFVVVREREILVLDAATGARRARVASAPGYVDTLCRPPVIDGDEIFAVLLDRMVGRADEPRENVLAAIDLRTGAVRWRAPMQVSTCMHHTPVIADATSVLVCFDDQFLRAHDRATGAETSALGLAGACENVALAPDATLERPIVARRGDERVILRRGASPPPPAIRARLRGRVLDERGSPVGGAQVLAVGRRATTDAGGRYELAIEGRGRVVVHALRDDAHGGARIALERDGDVDLDVTIAPPGPID